MRSTVIKGLGAALVAGTLGIASASAMPAGQLNSSVNAIGNAEQVRLICDEYGRCWRRRPYYAPRVYYGGGPAIYFGGGPRFYGHRHWGHHHHHGGRWGGRGRW